MSKCVSSLKSFSMTSKSCPDGKSTICYLTGTACPAVGPLWLFLLAAVWLGCPPLLASMHDTSRQMTVAPPATVYSCQWLRLALGIRRQRKQTTHWKEYDTDRKFPVKTGMEESYPLSAAKVKKGTADPFVSVNKSHFPKSEADR